MKITVCSDEHLPRAGRGVGQRVAGKRHARRMNAHRAHGGYARPISCVATACSMDVPPGAGFYRRRGFRGI